MTAVGWLPAPVEELFGTEATAEESYEVLTVDVPPASWLSALQTARDALGCTYFDWLSAVDEPGRGFLVSAHVVALPSPPPQSHSQSRPLSPSPSPSPSPASSPSPSPSPSSVRRLLVRTTVPHEAPVLPTAVGVYAGAGWHERETHEMFGVTFEGHPALDPLLLPEGFEGHPLRKDFVLAARVAKAWPGAKEPGESDHGGPKRRQMLPPGVPDPNDWGPLKGQLPPAPTRPARGAARAAGERPVRRTRTAGEGSASQTAAPATPPATTPATPTEAPSTPRRARTAAEGSASQTATPGTTPDASPEVPTSPRRARTASEGSATQRTSAPESTPAAGPRRARSASEGSATQRAQPDTSDTAEASDAAEVAETADAAETAKAAAATDTADAPVPADTGEEALTAARTTPKPAPRSSDAPWHHARPAFDEPEAEAAPEPTPKPPTDAAAGGPDAESDANADTADSGADAADADTEVRPAGPHPEMSPDTTPTPEDPTGGRQ
ncbi:NADH-quinone oxidoreductase subunit C [Streptomyces avermitilis]|uniref:NADH-quinone oxidoreductase subunit C n=1 Tax=Streptomyces avermitilis TaxID=33903 RepID=UPI0033AA960E